MTDTAAPTDLNITDLNITDVSASTDGCSCCAIPDATAVEPVPAATSGTTTELQVTGMTCGHCVTSVTTELSALDGVTGVDVALVKGGISTVTVQSAAPLATDAVAAAIDEAGYELA